MRFIQWTVVVLLAIALIAAINAKAPVTTIFLLAALNMAVWLVVAKQADLDDAADAANRARPRKIMCGTCHLEFDSLVEYNNHVYDLEHGHDPSDN